MRKTLVVCLCASATAYEARAYADAMTTCTDAASQGQIERDAHKLIEARNRFIVCAREECPAVVRKDCTAWLEQVQTSLPTVVPTATDETGNSLAAVKVSVDGKLLVEKMDGRAVELNPGTYMFLFEAPDGAKVEKQVVVGEGEKNKPITASFARARAATVAASPPPNTTNDAPTPPTALPVPPAESLDAQSSSRSPWKTVGLVTAGVGVVGLGIGTVFGVMASSNKSSAGCNSNSVCPTTTAESTLSTAQSDGNLSTGFFIAGAALGAAGIVVWALAPSRSVQVSPSVGAHSSGVVLRGLW